MTAACWVIVPKLVGVAKLSATAEKNTVARTSTTSGLGHG